MLSQLTSTCLIVSTMVGTSYATWACANNAAVNPSKTVNVPDSGPQPCNGPMVTQYLNLMDSAYEAARARGISGLPICATNVSIPGEQDSPPIGAIITVANVCCDVPNDVCNPNQLCAYPNDFRPNVSFPIGQDPSGFDQFLTCTDIAQMFIGSYGGNCAASTGIELNVKQAATIGCCGESHLTACGVGLTTCANPSDFKPNATALSVYRGNSLDCANLVSLFESQQSNCSAVPVVGGDNYSMLFKNVSASCCGSPSAQTVCDVPFPTVPPHTTVPPYTTVPPTSGSSRFTLTTPIVFLASVLTFAAMLM